MNVLYYDSTGRVYGAGDYEPGGFALPGYMIECTMEERTNFASLKVDLSVDPPKIVERQPSAAEMQAALTQAIQTILDTKAQAYNYDSITTAVTYADEPAVEKFQKEGQAFREWRSSVWAACYAYLGEVAAGQKPFPAEADLPNLLPPFSLDA